MRYVVSAEEYFGSINENQANIDKLQTYFESIPQAFWEALESIDLSPLKQFTPIKRTQSEDQILEHQLFLIENADDFAELVKKEDFLARLGYDTVALREQGEYFAKIETLNESVLSSVWNFLTAMVEDPDPVEMTLNVIRLVLDVIGLIPFTWAGVPIDVIANILSALISLYKGEYLSMVLSILAAIDVTQASDVLRFTLRGMPAPVMKGLEKLIRILCRSGKDSRAVENGILALREEVIKIGGTGIKGVFDLIIKILSGIAGFISNTFVMVLRTMTTFIDKVLSYVPIAGKYLAQTTKLVDNMILSMVDIGKNFDTAAKTLEKGGAGADAAIARSADDLRNAALRTPAAKAERTAIAAQARTDARAAGMTTQREILDYVSKKVKEFDQPIYDLYTTKPGYLADLTKEVQSSAKYEYVKEKLGKKYADAYLAAKVENEFIGQAKRTADIVLKDKELAAHLASIGWAPDGLQVIALARKGDVQGVKNFFEVFLTDSKIAKTLTNTEIRAFTPFVAKPEAFIAGVKNMDRAIKQLTLLEKTAGISQKRVIPLRRIFNFMLRLVWNKYGSLDCILQAGANAASEKVMGATSKLATGVMTQALSPVPTNEENSDPNAAAPAAGSENDALAILNKTMEENEKIRKGLVERKPDCGLTAAAVNATVGSHVANFPGSTATLGGTANMGDDAKKREEFEKNSTEYTKQILSSLKLDTTIDAQHAIEATDPSVRLAFADVADEETGVIELTPSDTGRMNKIADKMIKEEGMDPEIVKRALAKAKKMIDDGDMPEVPLPKSVNKKVDESLFKIKTIFTQNKD